MVSQPSRPLLTIALGVVLLANPLYVGHLHLDDANWHRYESAEVTYGEDGFDVPIRAASDGLDDDVACLAEQRPSRACAVETAVHERGNLTVPVSWGTLISDYGPLGYQYVYLNGSFYEPVVRDEADRAVLTLNRTPAAEAMRYAADPLSHAHGGVRKAIRSGSVKTHQPLDGANQLIRDGDTYYVVYEVAAHFQSSNFLGRLLEALLTVLGTGVGLFLVLRGQRHRVEGEWREQTESSASRE